MRGGSERNRSSKKEPIGMEEFPADWLFFTEYIALRIERLSLINIKDAAIFVKIWCIFLLLESLSGES